MKVQIVESSRKYVTDQQKQYKITIVKDGPYLVSGSVPLIEKIITPKGKSYIYKAGRTLSQAGRYGLCRCGLSENPPFCDGAHREAGFTGDETASKEPYDQRTELFVGPELDVYDDHRCALARFCHREQGSVWKLVKESDHPEYRQEVIEGSIQCPAGRLTVRDKQGNLIEPSLEPEIEVLQDPEKGVSGPLYVKGNIPIISADGELYEIRNRVTLCRCGQSKNKPFCDAAHIAAGFSDGFSGDGE